MVLNRQTDDQVEIPSTIFSMERERANKRDEGPSKSESRMRERERDREKVERPSESESRKQENSDL